jgi:hypothetical protein
MKASELEIKGNRLLLNKDPIIKTDSDIKMYLIIENGIIILTKEEPNDRNVYCYDLHGNLKWQIPEPDKLHYTNSYTSLYFSSTSELQAYNQNGVEVTLNKEDGSVIKKELIK